eukprot:9358-Rhodomonas_salina.1
MAGYPSESRSGQSAGLGIAPGSILASIESGRLVNLTIPGAECATGFRAVKVNLRFQSPAAYSLVSSSAPESCASCCASADGASGIRSASA